MERRFEHGLSTLQQLFLKASNELKIPVRFALIGGLAMSAWGVVRATEDIDLLADSAPSPLRDREFKDAMQGFLEARGCAAEWRVGGADDPIPLLLRVELPGRARGLKVDILWAHKRWQRGTLRPGATSVAVNNASDIGQTDARSFKLFSAVEALEYAEELVHIAHIETNTIVADKDHNLSFLINRR